MSLPHKFLGVSHEATKGKIPDYNFDIGETHDYGDDDEVTEITAEGRVELNKEELYQWKHNIIYKLSLSRCAEIDLTPQAIWITTELNPDIETQKSWIREFGHPDARIMEKEHLLDFLQAMFELCEEKQEFLKDKKASMEKEHES